MNMKASVRERVLWHRRVTLRLVGVMMCITILAGMLPCSMNEAQAKPKLTSSVAIKKESTKIMNMKLKEICYMHTGEKLTFSAGGTAEWSTSNTKVAKVSKSGVVTIPSDRTSGTCIIQAKVGNKIYKRRIVVSSVKLNNSEPFHVGVEQAIGIDLGEYGKGYDEDLERSPQIVKSTASDTSFINVSIEDFGQSLYCQWKKAGTVTVTATLVTDTGTTFVSKAQIAAVDVDKEEDKALEKWLKDNKVSITEEEAYQKIIDFQEIHPDYSDWGSEDYYGGVGGCGGFAMKLSNYIFGMPAKAEWNDEKWKADIRLVKSEISFFQTYIGEMNLINCEYAFPNGITWYANDYDRLKVGDMVFLNCGKVGDDCSHVCIVMSKGYFGGRECIRIAEGSSAGMASYGSVQFREDLENTRFLVASRY